MVEQDRGNLPTVSVIVPVYNAEKSIGKLIESLLNQDYPKELLEIIIVDNNSTDKSRRIVKKYPVELLQERDVQSSYAARNTGIRHAHGKILAFIDSDCEADAEWAKAGIEALTSKSADLAGGRVEFSYSKRETAAEYYDSITQMHTESSIKEQGAAATANLFARALLFDSVGLFPDSVRSGGDWQWTFKAVRSGFRLIYAPEAVVKHPARLLVPLLSKSFRIGRGAIYVWIDKKQRLGRIVYSTLMLLKPPRLSPVKKLISEKGRPEMSKKLLRVWLVSYLWNLSKLCGIVVSVLGLFRKAQRCERRANTTHVDRLPFTDQ